MLTCLSTPHAASVFRRPRKTGSQAARPACTAPARVVCARAESASPRAARVEHLVHHPRRRCYPCRRTRRLSRHRRLHLPCRPCRPRCRFHRHFPRRRHHTTKCARALHTVLRLLTPLAATVSFCNTRRGRFSLTQGVRRTRGDQLCTLQPMKASTFTIGQQLAQTWLNRGSWATVSARISNLRSPPLQLPPINSSVQLTHTERAASQHTPRQLTM